MSSKKHGSKGQGPRPQARHSAEVGGEHKGDGETGSGRGVSDRSNIDRARTAFQEAGAEQPQSTPAEPTRSFWRRLRIRFRRRRDQVLETESPEVQEKLVGRDGKTTQPDLELAKREELAKRDEDLAKRDEDLAKRDEDLAKREGELAKREEELEKRGEDLARRDEELVRRDEELVRRDEELARRDEEVARRTGEITQLSDKLARRDGKITKLSEELLARKGEVEDLKKTLSMYDECSEVEIASTMSGINTRIQILAHNTAQRWLQSFSRAPEGEGNTFLNENEMETFQRIVGPQLADALGRPPPERSRCVVLLLPLAWQASTLTVVEGIMSSFVEGLPVSERGWVVDEELRKVSELVKEGEIQPAYGRWRFITHQYLKRRINHEEAVQSYVREALEYCRIAARLALKSACPDNQTFVDDLQTQMTEIMEEAFKLRADIQEKKVTANYDPYLPRNGTPFQSDLMEVTKGDEQYSNDTVVCTTRLGMICSRKRGRENSSDVMKEVALKPQVLTDQNLGDIIS